MVGHSKSNIFVFAACASFLNQVVLLAFAVILHWTNSIENIPMLLWCKHNSALDSSVRWNIRRGQYTVSDITYCQSPPETLPPCWNQDEERLLHKIRVCGEYEGWYFAGRIILIALSTISSVLAINRLHLKSNYIQLYERTKTFMHCIQTNPELHRSVILDHSKDDTLEAKLQEMIENSRGKNEIVNRSNHEGETPLHASTRAGAIKCTVVLLKAGAVPRKNSRDMLPEFHSMLYSPAVLNELIELREKGSLPRDVLAELDNQTKQCSTATESDFELVTSKQKAMFLKKGDTELAKSKQQELFLDKGDFKSRRKCILWSYMDDGSRSRCHVEKKEDIEVHLHLL